MKNLSSLRSYSLALIVSMIVCLPAVLSAQSEKPFGIIPKKVAEFKKAGAFEEETNVFTVTGSSANQEAINKLLKNFTLLDKSPADILSQQPSFLNFTIPVEAGRKNIRILLYKESISPNGFNLLTSDGKKITPANDIVHYRGSIDGDESSVAAFSFSQNEIAGMVACGVGNYVIGKLNDHSGKYIIYNDRDLLSTPSFDCLTNTTIPVDGSTYFRGGAKAPATTSKCVNWYWETDYDVFSNKGSVANVNTFIQGIFNQVATLYANDGMSITLKTLYVWTAADPYTGPTTSDYLNQFGVYRTSFDGDLANLIGYQGGGGIAWINGLCNSLTRYKMAYSGISSSYSVVPTFSWTVECIAHEQGHVIGSRHTHDCVWNGNNTKIDGCGDVAGYVSGSCTSPGLPAGSGTIMSYCHLTSAGISFNLGFGPQPKALMVNNINNASCLTACAGCSVPGQPGNIIGSTAVCPATSKVYSIPAIIGATGYTWTLPTGWTGMSTSYSITVTTGTAGGTISVKANNACGSSIARNLAVTSSTKPATPATITGNISVCKTTSETYTAAAVAGAISYTWTLPAGWAGSSATNSITVTTGTAGGTISVKANSSCGTSTAKTLSVSIKAIPSTPGAVTIGGGSAKVCPGDSRTYTVPLVTGRTYNWIPPTGATISSGQGTNSITVYFTSQFINSGILSVTAINNCGTSTARNLTIAPNPAAIPGVISISGGDAKVCPGDARTYSVPLITGIAYNWSAPGAASISSGQDSSAVNISYTSNFIVQDTLKVTAANGCGISAARILIVKRNFPATPVIITGPVTVCPGSNARYTIAKVAGATAYTWTVPAGASIQGASSDTGVNVTWGSTAGIISVKASNACGISLARTLAVKISCTAPKTEKVSSISSVVLYPNPAKDMVTVKYHAVEKAVYNISITDLSGRVLLTENQYAITGINTRQFNLSGMLKGNYLVIIEGKNEKKILTLQVE